MKKEEIIEMYSSLIDMTEAKVIEVLNSNSKTKEQDIKQIFKTIRTMTQNAK